MTDTTDATFAKLRAIIADHFFVDEASVTPKTRAIDVPGWDSVSQVGLALRIEDDLGIELDPEALNDIPNVGALAAFIAAREEG